MSTKLKIDLINNQINGIDSYFLKYYNKIFNEGWIAGEEIKTTLKNLLEDLIEDKYDYDMTLAHMRIKFAEKYCIQTKHKFYGKPIKYMLWQKARKEVTYSFFHKDTGFRRFQQVIELVARKNGKSTDKASEGMTDLFIGGGGLDICCSSNDDAQADLIYQELNNMREAMDPKNKRSKKNQKGIFNLKNKSKVFKISDKTRNKEGRNIYTGYIDEIHEMQEDTIFQSIWQSTSTVDNPLIYEITTEGTVDGGYLDRRLVYARKVLKKEVVDEKLLVWLYTQDSEDEIWNDESSWWKSNPSLGEIKSWNYLRGNVEKAKVSREDRAFTLCKDFNIKQNKALAWLLEEDVNDSRTFKFEDFRGWYYIAGVDLSETTDLTSVDVMFVKNQVTYFKTMYFIPQGKYDDPELNAERKDYSDWQQKGYVTILPGNEVTHEAVTQWLYDLFLKYNIRPYKIGYDLWHAKGLVKSIEYYFGTDVCEKVRMDFNTLSNPLRILGADLKDHKVIYDDNPVSKWCLKNVALKVNNIGQVMPVKVQASKNRIDGALTKIICYAVKSNWNNDFYNLNKMR